MILSTCPIPISCSWTRLVGRLLFLLEILRKQGKPQQPLFRPKHRLGIAEQVAFFQHGQGGGRNSWALRGGSIHSKRLVGARLRQSAVIWRRRAQRTRPRPMAS